MPKVSIVIPLYNKAPYIERALCSVLAQTFQDFEVIIIDDGSTDNSVEVVKGIINSCIRLICQENAGVSAARNRGIAEAKTELIAFLDADDEWMPTFLETVLRLHAKYPNAGMYGTAYKYRMPGGYYEKPKYKYLPNKSGEETLINYVRVSLGDPPITASTVMIKKEALLKNGCFSIGKKLAEDLAVFMKISFEYPVIWSNQVCAIYFKDITDSATKTVIQKQDLVIIDTLKERLAKYPYDKNVSNLISRYYLSCAKRHSLNYDRHNSLICIHNTIKYAKGIFQLQMIAWRTYLSLPYCIQERLRYYKRIFNKYYYKLR